MSLRDAVRNWSSKDIVTVAFSLIALSLSAGSFYRSHYYVSHAVTLRVLETSKTHTRHADIHKADGDEHALTLPLIFINTGNRDAMVLEISITVAEGSAGGGAVLDQATDAAPFILKAGDIKVVNMDIGASDILFHAGSGLDLHVGTIDAGGQNTYKVVRVGSLARLKNDAGEDVSVLNVDVVNAQLLAKPLESSQ